MVGQRSYPNKRRDLLIVVDDESQIWRMMIWNLTRLDKTTCPDNTIWHEKAYFDLGEGSCVFQASHLGLKPTRNLTFCTFSRGCVNGRINFKQTLNN